MAQKVHLQLLRSFVHAQVAGLDFCFQKPLLLSYSKEKIVIWNYVTNGFELERSFDDQLTEAALHPTGLYLAVAFVNRVSFYSIHFDEIIELKTFDEPIKKCNHVAFSPLGHQLAVSYLNVIQVFNSVSYKSTAELRFRAGKVEDFQWFPNELFIASCTNFGLVCIWDVVKAERLCECSLKFTQCLSLSAQISYSQRDDTKVATLETYVLDKANNLRRLSVECEWENKMGPSRRLESELDLVVCCSLNNRETEKSVQESLQITSLCPRIFEGVVLFGSQLGGIYNTDKDLTNPSLADQTSSSIIDLKTVSFKAVESISLLFTCSADGSIKTYYLTRKSESLSATETLTKIRQINWLNDVLICKAEINHIEKKSLSLKQTLIEQSDEQKYQLRIKEMVAREQVRTLNYEHKMNLARLRGAIKKFENSLELREDKRQSRLKQIEAQLTLQLEQLREKCDEELMEIYKSNDELLEKRSELTKQIKLEETALQAIREREKSEIEKLEQHEKSLVVQMEKEKTTKITEKRAECQQLEKRKELVERVEDDLMCKLREDNKNHIQSCLKANHDLRMCVCQRRLQLDELEQSIARLEFKRDDDKTAHQVGGFLAEKKQAQAQHEARTKQMHELAREVELKKALLDDLRRQILVEQRRHSILDKTAFVHQYQHSELEKRIEPLSAENETLKHHVVAEENRLDQLELDIEAQKNQTEQRRHEYNRLRRSELRRAKSSRTRSSKLEKELTGLASDLTHPDAETNELLVKINNSCPQIDSS